MKKRFLAIAAAAVVATLASPGVSPAAFTVTLTAGSKTQDFQITAGDTAGTFSQSITFQGFTIDVIAKTNTPGGPEKSYVTDTAIAVRADKGGSGNLDITLTSEGFNFPSASTQSYVKTDLSTQAVFEASSVTGSSSLIYGPSSVYNAPSSVTLKKALDVGSATDITTIVSAPFAIQNLLSFTGFGNNKEAYASITTTVTQTPAPAGLFLAAGAVPFLGLLRRRLRTPETTVEV